MSDELHERNVAWYAAMLNAFVNSRREKDKSLLALSTAGIGLLITLATTVGIPNGPILGLYVLAIGAFLIAIFYALRLFDLDAKHVESLLRELRDDAAEEKLKAADHVLFWAFAAGVGFSILIGGAYAWSTAQQREEMTMSEASTKTPGAGRPGGTKPPRDREP